MNDMVNWLFAKIMAHLRNKEGCYIETPIKTSDSLRAVVQDSLGFRYEIQIKCLGRLYNEVSEYNKEISKTN